MNSFIKFCVKIFLEILPKSKKKIIFESNSDFCDNSRAFYEYLIENNYNQSYKLVWCVSDPKKFSNYKKKNVFFTSFRDPKYFLNYILHIGTAKTIIYAHAMPPFINTKRQDVACLWHGTPLKYMNFEEKGIDPFSFLLSSSEWCSKALCECFHIQKEKTNILGYPRCDLLFKENNSLAKLNINKDKYNKIILWMPTFRQNKEYNFNDSYKTQTGLPLIDNKDRLIELNEYLTTLNCLIIIKLHPLQDLNDIDLVSLTNIKMLTNDELDANDVQLYHLVSKADILLTDYSSIYFDYLLLNRPIGFILDDYKIYKQKRGFVVDNPLDFMPGHHIYSIDQLNKFIKDAVDEIDLYTDQREKINNIMNVYKDDKSCYRLAKYLDLA